MGMAAEIAAHLVANGYGSTTAPSPTIFADFFPGQPDNVISVNDTTGFEPERAMGRLVMETRNLQILVRNTTRSGAETIANNIFTLLDRFDGTLSGTRYYSILGRTTPFSLGRDENNRHRWTCNYVVRKDMSA